MKVHSLFLTLSLLSVLGSGCVSGSIKKDTSAIVTSSVQTVSGEGGDPVPYRTLFQREAKPEWRAVRFDGFSLSIPYSPRWKISDTGLSVYDEENLTEKIPLIRFGRPSDAGMFIAREYFVYRESREGTFEDNALPRLKIDLEFACIDGFGSERMTIGRVEGILHHTGGAKGCSTGFAFNRGRYTYYVYKAADIQQNAPEIDEETRRVVESIHE